MLFLTCGISVTHLFFISGLELIFRQQTSFFQQPSLFPLLPFFQNDLREINKSVQLKHILYKKCSVPVLVPERVGGHTFLRGVGFFAFGTSLCLPFFTKGLVESRGLWAILSCCQGSFFWTNCCFWTTGSPPPTTKKNHLQKQMWISNHSQ